jgi:hypothetical protein
VQKCFVFDPAILEVPTVLTGEVLKSNLNDYTLEQIQEEVRELNREKPGRDEIFWRLNRIDNQVWWNFVILLFIGAAVIVALVGIVSLKHLLSVAALAGG